MRQDSLVPKMAVGARRPGEPLFPPGHVPTDEPRFWQLGYDAAGNLIGLVTTRRNGPNGTSGSMNWIGVVSEQPGRGYVDDLIARGSELLVAAGVERVHGATNVLSTPMRTALPRMGFRRTETHWWYELDVTHVREPGPENRAGAEATP